MKKYTDPAATVLLECADLLQRKSADYNRGFSRDTYALYGRQSHMQSIHTKYLRLRSLIENEGDINFESIEDTLCDIANYAAIWVDWERRNAKSK